MSHLACADETGNVKNSEQLTRFEKVAGFFPDCRKSLANSAGVVLGERYRFDLVRPGIALYGGAFSDLTGPLQPVAKLEGRILQIRQVKRNETVGYGGVAGAETDRTIAIAGLGYGDGILRSASGAGVPLRQVCDGGHGWAGGHKVSVVGRISMDTTAFDVTRVPAAKLEARPWIEFFGENATLDDFANAAGTIAYEVLTGMGSRVSRKYVNEAGVESDG
jgi:alanine racemase